MPHDRFQWFGRIKAIEREYSAAQLALDRLRSAIAADPTILMGDIRARDIRHASELLEGTYIIRLFAEFETALRLFWPAARTSDPPSRTRDLLDGVAATRRVPNDMLLNAHKVREYRNSLVHERDDPILPISIAETRSHLCKFLGRLPERW